MTTHDFIFANQPRYRILRHVLFWLCWFVFFQLAYHYPTMVFPDWNYKARMDFFTKTFGADLITLRGGWLHMIWEVGYRQSSILFCQMLFTYAVIYYILPRYLSKGKPWFTTTVIFLFIIALSFLMHYFFVYLGILDSARTFLRKGLGRPPGTRLSGHFSFRDLWQFRQTLMEATLGTVSFNLATVTAIALTISLMKRWWLKLKEASSVAQEKITAELQLLKAQIHPHFLFNSLNNIYSFALEGSHKAPEMIKRLSGLIHYMLYGCKYPFVPLEKEIRMIEDYVSLEKIRYGDRLKIDVQLQKLGNNQFIAPLLLIPFVENSFKHGTSKTLTRPYVALNCFVEGEVLYFKLSNSKPYPPDEISTGGNRGLGLKNVKKRLELLYPEKHELHIVDDPSSYTVWLKINLSETWQTTENDFIKKEMIPFELA